MILLVAGIVLHQLGIFAGPAAKSAADTARVVITPGLEGQECNQDAAWSPDGRQVAVLGYRDQCPNYDFTAYNYQPGVLAIYSAATGKLVRTILPDATVLALPRIPLPPADVQPASADSDTSKPVINYTQVLWSPNGQQLALTFYIGRWNNIGSSSAAPTYVVAVRGVVLVNADGTNERAALFTEESAQDGALRWDTTTLNSVELPVQSSYGENVSLPPAESYSWSAQGQLVPRGSLTTAPSLTTPVGNPDGGRSFTLWQPGLVSLTEGEVNGSGAAVEPGVYSWNTTFAAWSPDGRYLIDSVSLNGIVHPAGEPRPSAAGVDAVGLEGAPNLAVRDPALQRLLTSLHAPTEQGGQSGILVAWSPSGRVLAAMPAPSFPSESTASTPVTFYDSATGKTLAVLQPKENSDIFTSSGLILCWSADGSHVLFYSAQLDTITIWGPGMLPLTP